jgi:hypothetical protein
MQTGLLCASQIVAFLSSHRLIASRPAPFLGPRFSPFTRPALHQWSVIERFVKPTIVRLLFCSWCARRRSDRLTPDFIAMPQSCHPLAIGSRKCCFAGCSNRVMVGGAFCFSPCLAKSGIDSDLRLPESVCSVETRAAVARQTICVGYR